MAELIPPGPPQAPEQYNHTAYFTDPVLPMEGLENDAYYRAPVQQISTQTFTALCKEFCAQVPKFGGQSGEDVVKFIKRVDQTMHDLRMPDQTNMTPPNTDTPPIGVLRRLSPAGAGSPTKPGDPLWTP